LCGSRASHRVPVRTTSSLDHRGTGTGMETVKIMLHHIEHGMPAWLLSSRSSPEYDAKVSSLSGRFRSCRGRSVSVRSCQYANRSSRDAPSRRSWSRSRPVASSQRHQPPSPNPSSWIRRGRGKGPSRSLIASSRFLSDPLAPVMSPTTHICRSTVPRDTDVVSGAETKVIDDHGRMRPASCRPRTPDLIPLPPSAHPTTLNTPSLPSPLPSYLLPLTSCHFPVTPLPAGSHI
jgi:hypothetical protein